MHVDIDRHIRRNCDTFRCRISIARPCLSLSVGQYRDDRESCAHGKRSHHVRTREPNIFLIQK